MQVRDEDPAAQAPYVREGDEECVEWGDDVLEMETDDGLMDRDLESRGSVWAALCTMLCSLPALIGSWCWPVLLAAIIPSLGSSVNTSSSQAFSHSLTFGLNFAVLTNMFQFMLRKRNRRKQKYVVNSAVKSHFYIWGPCYLLFFSIFFIMADLTRHLVNDSWRLQNCDPVDKSMTPNKQTCEVHGVMNEYLPNGYLSIYGVVFTIIFTWIGFILMAVGILWGLDLPQKMLATYRKTRYQSRQGSSSPSPRLEHPADPLLDNGA